MFGDKLGKMKWRLMGGKERKAFHVGGGMIHGELENGKKNVGFRAQNMLKEESLKGWT